MEIHFIGTIEIVAWWGAIVATAVLLWDIYKWRTSGAKIVFRASPNMTTINIPECEGKTWISATAQNNGDRPTTITHLCFASYKNWLYRIFKKTDKNFFVANAGQPSGQHIPYVLNPGCIWQGVALQDKELETSAREKSLFCYLYCSHKKKPKRYRIRIKEPITTQSTKPKPPPE